MQLRHPNRLVDLNLSYMTRSIKHLPFIIQIFDNMKKPKALPPFHPMEGQRLLVSLLVMNWAFTITSPRALQRNHTNPSELDG